MNDYEKRLGVLQLTPENLSFVNLFLKTIKDALMLCIYFEHWKCKPTVRHLKNSWARNCEARLKRNTRSEQASFFILLFAKPIANLCKSECGRKDLAERKTLCANRAARWRVMCQNRARLAFARSRSCNKITKNYNANRAARELPTTASAAQFSAARESPHAPSLALRRGGPSGAPQRRESGPARAAGGGRAGPCR